MSALSKRRLSRLIRFRYFDVNLEKGVIKLKRKSWWALITPVVESIAFRFLETYFKENPRYGKYRYHHILHPDDFWADWMSSKFAGFTPLLQERIDTVREAKTIPDFIVIHCNKASSEMPIICRACGQREACTDFLFEVYEVKHAIGKARLLEVREKELKLRQREFRKIALQANIPYYVVKVNLSHILEREFNVAIFQNMKEGWRQVV